MERDISQCVDPINILRPFTNAARVVSKSNVQVLRSEIV